MFKTFKNRIYGNTAVFNNAKIFDDAKVYDNALVCDTAKVHGDACVSDNAVIQGNAVVKNNEDYMVFKNNWSTNRYFTYTKSNGMWKHDFFYGTSKELLKKAYQDSEHSGKCYEAYVKLVEQLETIQNDK